MEDEDFAESFTHYEASWYAGAMWTTATCLSRSHAERMCKAGLRASSHDVAILTTVTTFFQEVTTRSGRVMRIEVGRAIRHEEVRLSPEELAERAAHVSRVARLARRHARLRALNDRRLTARRPRFRCAPGGD